MRNRSGAARFAVLVVGAIFTACSATPTIHTEASPTANFAAYRSYAWASPGTPLSPPLAAPPLSGVSDWRIRNAVEAELAAHGWSMSSTPDILLGYGVILQDMNTESFSDYARYVREGGREDMGTAFVDGYQQGTLVLQLYDGSTGQLVWRGTATAVMSSGGGDVARDAVRQLLGKLPRQ